MNTKESDSKVMGSALKFKLQSDLIEALALGQ